MMSWLKMLIHIHCCTGICEIGYKGSNCDVCDTSYFENSSGYESIFGNEVGSGSGSGSGFATIPPDCKHCGPTG